MPDIPEPEFPPPNEPLTLHGHIPAREQLDGILDAPHLSLPEAVAAIDALHHENQDRLPHVVIARVMVAQTMGGSRDTEYLSYVGPFDDRPDAERWAARRYKGIKAVT